MSPRSKKPSAEKDGTLPIDRTFPPPVGRLRFRSGTHHAATRDGISRLLSALWDVGRHDVLTAFGRRQLSPLVVYGDWRTAKFSAAYLERMPGAEVLTPLEGAWRAWLRTYDRAGDEHRTQLGVCLMRLLSVHQGPTAAAVADLPDLLAAYREAAHRLGHARAFNLTKAAAQSFVRSTLRRKHPLYIEVQDIEPLKVTAKRVNRPFTVAELDRLCGALIQGGSRGESDPGKGAHAAAIARAMALTGMHAKEYWGAWDVRPACVHIDGTKRRGRVRDVPRVLPPTWYAAPGAMTRKAWEQRFEGAVVRAGLAPRVVYDLRRTFATWLANAGVPLNRREIYRGHATAGMRALYEQQELVAFWTEDAERVRAYIDRERAAGAAGLTLVKEG